MPELWQKCERCSVDRLLDYYYNTKRKHSSIGYKNPNQFEENLTKAA
jgi:transposase InsO family protein